VILEWIRPQMKSRTPVIDNHDKLVLTDAKGGTSTVTIADVFQSNGVIHVVDTVLMPNIVLIQTKRLEL
jgi:mannose/fructose-specific phosphotransferase system component IIA